MADEPSRLFSNRVSCCLSQSSYLINDLHLEGRAPIRPLPNTRGAFHLDAFLGGEIRFRISHSIGKSGFTFWKSQSGFPNRTHPGFSDRWKVVASDRKLRYGAEPVTRRDTKMTAELKCVNGTRNSVRNVPTGKTGLPFRFSTFSGNFPVGRADETFSTYCRTEISGNFD